MIRYCPGDQFIPAWIDKLQTLSQVSVTDTFLKVIGPDALLQVVRANTFRQGDRGPTGRAPPFCNRIDCMKMKKAVCRIAAVNGNQIGFIGVVGDMFKAIFDQRH